MRIRNTLLLATAACALTAGLARAASAPRAVTPAADASAAPAVAATVEDVIVTARRTSERAQEVPISLSVVSGKTLTDTGAYTLTDLQANTPSLVAYNSNPRNSSVAIRGIGLSSASDGLDYSVGVYVDGVYLGRPGMALEDLIDVDQIEVLRGPQGTLFGRNTSAGVLNITTAKPSFDFGGTAEASVGNYGYNQERLSATGPLVRDVLAFRLTAFNTHRSGTLPNLTTGVAANSVQRTGARFQLYYKPIDKLSLRLITEYSNENDTCCVSVLKQVVPSLDPKAIAAFNLLGYNPVASFTSVRANAPQNMLTDQHSASAELNWDLGWANLTSISAYRYWHFAPLQDSDGTPLDVLQVNVAQTRDEQYSQEIRLSSNPGRITWQAGVYAFDQILRDHYILNKYGTDATAFYRALTGANSISVPAGSQYIDDARSVTQSYAVFGQANVKITDQLILTGGVRYTYDDKHGVSQSSTIGSPYVKTPFAYDVSVTNGNVSYLASLSYKPTTSTLIYASYSTGYKDAGLNLNSVVPPNGNVVIQPEYAEDWEVGIKQTLFDRHLVFNVNGFWTNLKGLQANYYPPSGSKSYLTNAGDLTSRGFEADATLSLDNGLSLSVNGSYDDAYYTKFTGAPCPPGVTGVCNLTGRPVYEAPRYIANATAQYRFSLNDWVSPYALVQYAYRSSVYGAIDDWALAKLPAYSLVNARLGAAIQNGRYDVSVWVNNALNAKYYYNLGPASFQQSGTYGVSGQPGTPQTFGATLRVSF
jgi:iron complex outermembrane receptor protein